MSTTTTNFGLVLPIGTENVSRQIINENNTKIDAALTNVSLYTEKGTFNSLESLSTALTNELNGMINNETRCIRLSCNGSFDNFYSGVAYFVDVKKSSMNYSSCMMQGVGYPSQVFGMLIAGTWSFDEFAINHRNQDWITNVNLNNLKTTGTYCLSTGLSNNPANLNWAIVTVVAPKLDIVYQLFEANCRLFIREFRQNNWSAWKEFTTSVV